MGSTQNGRLPGIAAGGADIPERAGVVLVPRGWGGSVAKLDGQGVDQG